MSLGEVQQIYEMLQQIDTLLSDIGTKTENIQSDLPVTQDAVMSIREGTRVLYRFNHILAHMGLPPDIQNDIRLFQQLVFMARMVEMSMALIEMATPYGYLMGALGIASVFLSSSDMITRIGE